MKLELIVKTVTQSAKQETVRMQVPETDEKTATVRLQRGGQINLVITDAALFGRYKPEQIVAFKLTEVPAAE